MKKLLRKNLVSEACQINDLDHAIGGSGLEQLVSEACQINDLDHISEIQ